MEGRVSYIGHGKCNPFKYMSLFGQILASNPLFTLNFIGHFKAGGSSCES
ncbi:hypothetical protein NSPZN2_30285 [Nitrospira defluvii]|uniref:Uncharacterized protein n=1 Tax=Nitrospira defluvii TaxID=330214 RepID=A0ABM8RHS5_9BACT|nr:hypothetical protein NSPZN2_30285 [Nitrospira defluvii]